MTCQKKKKRKSFLSFQIKIKVYFNESTACRQVIRLNVENHGEEINYPLHEAARRGNQSFLQECLKQGVSATGLDQMGNTPLYWASHGGHLDCVTQLLAQSNTMINAQNKIGDTALHVAAARGHFEVVERLLQHGADSWVQNKDQQTALELAMSSAVVNAIQLNRSASFSNTTSVTYSAADYADDSD
ncbi:hypothetical protein PR048_009606 [Dryococelus australis]|uniref:ANK_REP_REGION domain-containing protein n=1 Tax=Dryococelus australis TaxID=614101 RepID=A0ABQ9I0E6_9NEOP|nr:hypothetical protein PR048_009606 [Dryococelus australis]